MDELTCSPSCALLTTCPALRTFSLGKSAKTQVKSSSATPANEAEPCPRGHHQENCQRSAPQSAQKCVPEKNVSLLNSVLGVKLRHAACHDPEELECQRSAPRCAKGDRTVGTSTNCSADCGSGMRERNGHGEQEILGTSITCSATGNPGSAARCL